MNTVWIALGSNLDSPTNHIAEALAAIGAHEAIDLLAASSLYQTAPVGYLNQPDFINAVAKINTTLSPEALLSVLQMLENQAGRVRTFRNAPRPLDLDIIDFAGKIQDESHLQLPHPRAHERAFVMVPLAEISPEHYLPRQTQSAQELAASLPQEGMIWRLKKENQ